MSQTSIASAFRGLELYIFDMDGTLVDSKQDLIEAVHHAARSIGLEPRTDDEIAGYLASGSMSLVKEALGAHERFEEAFGHFTRYYQENMFTHTKLCPGVLEVLEALRGRRKLAIMSNKRERFCRQLAEGFGIENHFQWIVGGDTYPAKKPDPLPLQGILTQAGISADRAIMVGDSPQDVEAGKRAGMRTLALLNGFTSPEILQKAEADIIVASMVDVIPWL